MLTIVAVLFFVFLFINVPVAFALALSTIPAFLLTDYMPLTVAVQRMYGATQSFPLLAVPFFILAGNLMNTSGITERLLRFARLLTGWMVGGLAQVSIVLSALMGGISGAAVADAAMEARILGPTMVERGYDKGFAATVIAFSSIITVDHSAEHRPDPVRLHRRGLDRPAAARRRRPRSADDRDADDRHLDHRQAQRLPAGAAAAADASANSPRSFRECFWALVFPSSCLSASASASSPPPRPARWS